MPSSSTPQYIPDQDSPLPPVSAEILTTACDYCVVACGYKVYRWPVGLSGGPLAHQNAFGIDFPSYALQAWVAPTQHNIVSHNGQPHHIVIIPDKETDVVNKKGDSSLRGGTIAQKVYNPNRATKDRLKHPLMRIDGRLQKVSWEFALDIAAAVNQYAIECFGANAYSVKTYSYQYIENTYAITKYALRHIDTAAFAYHDTPSNVTSTPGLRDAGFDNFSASYEDWNLADTLLICGTDPYETKTIIYTQYIMPAMKRGQKVIMMNPRETAGVAHVKKMGGLHLDIFPGTDLVVLNAIASLIVLNKWQDDEWIKQWVANKWESSAGFGQGTRNTPWQWRSTWNVFQTDGFEDWKQWLLSCPEHAPDKAAELAGIAVEKIYTAAEWMAKPSTEGRRPKTSLGFEKGFYWSNNTGNTNAISALAIIVGAGGRPGQVLSRFGGHQRGGQEGGKYNRNKSPEKVPGRRRRALDTDRWLTGGHTRVAHVIGTTWIQSMTGSAGLADAFDRLVTHNPNQVVSHDKQQIIETLKRRMDSGGTVVLNQDIYLIAPIGAKYADIIFPAATWGEVDFMRANGERRLRLYQKFYDAPGEAKPDWWIIAQLGKRMGFDGFDWETSNEVAEEASRFSRNSRKAFHMMKIYAHKKGRTLHQQLRKLGTTGMQGPTLINEQGQLEGTQRLHDVARKLPDKGADGFNVLNKKLTHFNSQSGKLNLQKAPWELFSDFWYWMQPRDGELWHTNGRINEIWQTNNDGERNPYILQRWPESFVEVHPDDAATRGIESGDKVLLYSNRVPVQKETILGVQENDYRFNSLLKRGFIEIVTASLTCVAVVTPHIKRGVIFTNCLDKVQPSNVLQARVVDWVSGNYNYKMGVARIKKVGESRYKHDFSAMSFAPRNITISS